MLDRSAPCGSLVGTGHKNKYPAGVLYLPVTKYLASEPDLANQKQLLSGLIDLLRAGLTLPGRYVVTCIYPISTFGTFTYAQTGFFQIGE